MTSLKEFKSKLALTTIDSRRQILVFGVVLFINYPLYYIIWINTASQSFESLTLRLIASALCLPLIFNKYWPEKKLHWLTIYWYLSAGYCLPFFFTFMSLKNNAGTLWLMNLISATFFILLIFDVITSLLLLVAGTSIGIFAFKLSGSSFHYNPGLVNLSDIIATLLAAIIIGGIFSRNKQVVEEMKRRSIKAEADIQAKTEVIEELRQANEKAEAANQAKTEFISNMQHDLKTPFAGISAIAAFLYEIETDSEKRSLIEDLLKSCKRWEKVQHQIIAVLSVKEPVALKKEWISISGELDEIREEFASILHVKGLDFFIDAIPEEMDWVETDKMKLTSILSNLIGNAINFTEKGTVKVTVINESPFCKINIIDTGIGIPNDKLEYIFEQFTKLSKSNIHDDFKGVGLGLYSSRQKAIQLGGDIQVKSQLGVGSTFILILPFKSKNE